MLSNSPARCALWCSLILVVVACGGNRPECPAEMVYVGQPDAGFCVHQFEVSLTGQVGNLDQGVGFPDGSTAVTLQSRAGLSPTKTSWYQAYASCENAGFRLCTSEEWQDACDDTIGAGGGEYPTPDGTYDPSLCPIGDFRVQKQAELGVSGAYPNCHTKSGVHDMLGNLWEWANPASKDSSGLPQIDKRGGGHYGAEPVSCDRAAVGSHTPSFEGTIGFRCCSGPI